MNTRIHTCTGSFDPFRPSFRDVSLRDIARGLANTCRFGGQTPRFYSVAQHAVRCAELALLASGDRRTALFALHHDDAEAFLGDVVRPLKHATLLHTRTGIETFDLVEARVLREIHRGLNLGWPNESQEETVRQADDAQLRVELECLFGVDPSRDTLIAKASLGVRPAPLAPEDCLAPDAAMALFLRAHSDLSDGAGA